MMVMGMNMIRAKVLAVLLGPGGTGIIGLYSTTTDLVNTISGLGLTSSAVKQIAASNAEVDKEAIRKTLFVYRWLIRLTTFTAAICMFFFAKSISQYTFGSADNSYGIKWMSLVVLFAGMSNGQMALLQGLRRIKDLAMARMIGAFIGSIVCVILVFFFRKEGIVPFLIAGAATTLLLSWLFTQKEKIPSLRVNFKEFKIRAISLLSLGFAFLISGLTGSLSGYYSRILISKSFSIKDLGLYTASWTLSAIYVNFILTAMGADFYPRLSGIIHDNEKSNKLVNEQAKIGIVMAISGIVAVISFSPIILRIFYSQHFSEAWRLLQWMALGMAIKVISWPLGYIIISKGRAKIFIFLEVSWGVIYISLLYFFTKWMGLEGAGIAFFITYGINFVLVWIAAKILSGFKWNTDVKKQIIWLFTTVMLVFISSRILLAGWQYLFNTIIFLIVLFFAYRNMKTILGGSLIALFIKKIRPKNNE